MIGWLMYQFQYIIRLKIQDISNSGIADFEIMFMEKHNIFKQITPDGENNNEGVELLLTMKPKFKLSMFVAPNKLLHVGALVS